MDHRLIRRAPGWRMRAAACLAVLAMGCLPGLAPVAGAAERVIHQATSKFNETVLVSEDDEGLRMLRFEPDGARQSVVKPGDPDHLEVPYARAFPAVLAWVPHPRNVLVVGLGGGTVPAFLRKRVPEADIDVVELDPAVLAVAKSHFGFREDEHLHAHLGDGRRFIERAGKAYDLILLDAYGANQVPYSLATREFLRLVKRALAPRGVVVGNVWGREYNPLYDGMVRTYLSVYPSVSLLDLDGAANKLVIASPSLGMPDRDEVVLRAGEITRRLSLRVDLVPMVRAGLRAPDASERAGRLLTDGRRRK